MSCRRFGCFIHANLPGCYIQQHDHIYDKDAPALNFRNPSGKQLSSNPQGNGVIHKASKLLTI